MGGQKQHSKPDLKPKAAPITAAAGQKVSSRRPNVVEAQYSKHNPPGRPTRNIGEYEQSVTQPLDRLLALLGETQSDTTIKKRRWGERQEDCHFSLCIFQNVPKHQLCLCMPVQPQELKRPCPTEERKKHTQAPTTFFYPTSLERCG
jgi:hypothetical protein